MSIVNRMLQELDRRNAIRSDSHAQALASKVRPVAPASRVGSDAFWRSMALLMALAVGWVGWLIWQLTPRHVVTPLALQEAATRRVPPASAPAPAPTIAPEPAQPEAGAEAASEPAREATDGLKLSTELSTPIQERAPKPAATVKPEIAEAPKAPKPVAPAKAPAATEAAKAPAPARPAPAAAAKPPVPAVPVEAAKAQPKPAVPPAAVARAAPGEPRIQRSVPQSSHERAEREYQRALGFANQGRIAEGIETLQGALAAEPGHEGARLTLVTLLIEGKRYDDAVRALRDGLALNPMNLPLAMRLARVHVERGDSATALSVLESHSQAGYLNAEYHGFRAALYQRSLRHREAVGEFDEALKLSPGSSNWWIGRGISLQAIERPQDALDSFRRAKQSGNLSPDLTAFVDQRIRQLQ